MQLERIKEQYNQIVQEISITNEEEWKESRFIKDKLINIADNSWSVLEKISDIELEVKIINKLSDFEKNKDILTFPLREMRKEREGEIMGALLGDRDSSRSINRLSEKEEQNQESYEELISILESDGIQSEIDDLIGELNDLIERIEEKGRRFLDEDNQSG